MTLQHHTVYTYMHTNNRCSGFSSQFQFQLFGFTSSTFLYSLSSSFMSSLSPSFTPPTRSSVSPTTIPSSDLPLLSHRIRQTGISILSQVGHWPLLLSPQGELPSCSTGTRNRHPVCSQVPTTLFYFQHVCFKMNVFCAQLTLT